MKRNFFLFAVFAVVSFLSRSVTAQWVQTNGPYGGDIRSLVVSGTNLFAGTNGGVFLSTDNGTNWTAVNTGLTAFDVRALAVSGTNLFAGTDAGGVFLSTNNGISWIAVNTGLTGTFVTALAVSGTNLFAGTYANGVFLSTDNGASWMAVTNGVPPNTYVNVFAVNGKNLIAGTHGGAFISRSTMAQTGKQSISACRTTLQSFPLR